MHKGAVRRYARLEIHNRLDPLYNLETPIHDQSQRALRVTDCPDRQHGQSLSRHQLFPELLRHLRHGEQTGWLC